MSASKVVRQARIYMDQIRALLRPGRWLCKRAILRELGVQDSLEDRRLAETCLRQLWLSNEIKFIGLGINVYSGFYEGEDRLSWL